MQKTGSDKKPAHYDMHVLPLPLVQPEDFPVGLPGYTSTRGDPYNQARQHEWDK